MVLSTRRKTTRPRLQRKVARFVLHLTPSRSTSIVSNDIYPNARDPTPRLEKPGLSGEVTVSPDPLQQMKQLPEIGKMPFVELSSI